MHCPQLQAVDVPKQSGPCPEPRGCLPVACSAPARAGGICCDNSMPGHLFLGAPRPVERQGLSRGWGSGDTAGRYLLAVYRGAMPTSGPGSVASAEVVSYEAIRAAWLQLRMPYAPGASETVSVVPHSCLWRNSGILSRTPWVPNGTGQRCVGRNVVPEPYSSWLLAKWVRGAEWGAGSRTLSSHGPENPEGK